MHVQVAKTVDAQLGALGGQRLLPLGQGDEDSGKVEEHFETWSGAMLQALKDGPSEGAAAETEGHAQSDGSEAGTLHTFPDVYQPHSMPNSCNISEQHVELNRAFLSALHCLTDVITCTSPFCKNGNTRQSEAW